MVFMLQDFVSLGACVSRSTGNWRPMKGIPAIEQASGPAQLPPG